MTTRGITIINCNNETYKDHKKWDKKIQNKGYNAKECILSGEL